MRLCCENSSSYWYFLNGCGSDIRGGSYRAYITSTGYYHRYSDVN